MRSSAARFRARWRRPIPGCPRYELAANPARTCRPVGDGWECPAPGPGAAADCGTCSGHLGVGAGGPAQQHPALRVAGTDGGLPYADFRLAGAVAIAADDADYH